jgi:hypothetical protein
MKVRLHVSDQLQAPFSYIPEKELSPSPGTLWIGGSVVPGTDLHVEVINSSAWERRSFRTCLHTVIYLLFRKNLDEFSVHVF